MTERELSNYQRRRIKYSEIIDWLVEGKDVDTIMLLCKYKDIKVSRSTVYTLKKEYIDGLFREDFLKGNK